MCVSSVVPQPNASAPSAADRAGMAVGNRVRRARQDDAEFRRHHVRDALLGIADVEQSDAVRRVPSRIALMNAAPDGLLSSSRPGFGGDGVVLHRESQVRPVHLALLLLQMREGMVRMQLMQNVTVDIEQIAAVGALPDQMRSPRSCRTRCAA